MESADLKSIACIAMRSKRWVLVYIGGLMAFAEKVYKSHRRRAFV